MPDGSPRVLIVCDNASLKMGGESARPVHYFRHMRKRGVEVWLFCHSRCRDELTGLLGDDISRVRFVPDTTIASLLWKMGKPFPQQVQVCTFSALQKIHTQWYQARQIPALIREFGIDIVHQPTPISPKQPSAIGGFTVPTVIGPLNGDINYPPAFSDRESAFVRAAVTLGRVGGSIANHLVRGKINAEVLLVSNQRTADALPGGIRGRVIQLTANAVNLETWKTDRSPDTTTPRFVFLGRLVDFKMVDLLLEAFAPVAERFPAKLEIIGDGPERPRLESITRQLKLESNVIFHGWKQYEACAAILSRCAAMVFPSLRECGGAVVMEAMAAAVPVIAADWGGPADYVGDDGAGILVRPDTRAGFVNGFTEAMCKLAASPELVQQMSDRAHQRAVAHFQWDSRIDALLDVYQQIVNRPRATADAA